MEACSDITVHLIIRRLLYLVYKNAEVILPERLLKELQKYLQGELIYIPKSKTGRAGWGANNGTKAVLNERNRNIYAGYLSGKSVYELTDAFHLSEDSIRKIIRYFRTLG